MGNEARAIGRINPVTQSPSLLTSATDRSGDGFGLAPEQSVLDGHTMPGWRTGVTWTTVACARAHNWPRCQDDPDAEKEPPTGLDGPASVESFGIYVALDCDEALDGEKIAQDAQDLLDVRSAWGLARALWMGEGLPDSPDQPTLRNTAVNVSTGAVAHSLTDVIANLLGHYEDCTGGAGGAVVHLPSVLVAPALAARIMWPEGNLYRGANGAVFSPGPGYPAGASAGGVDGFGPLTAPDTYAGNDLDEAWVVVSGPVEYALTAAEALPLDEADRRGLFRRNSFEVWAERQAIVRFDPCCVFAALADSPSIDVP